MSILSNRILKSHFENLGVNNWRIFPVTGCQSEKNSRLRWGPSFPVRVRVILCPRKEANSVFSLSDKKIVSPERANWSWVGKGERTCANSFFCLFSKDGKRRSVLKSYVNLSLLAAGAPPGATVKKKVFFIVRVTTFEFPSIWSAYIHDT